MKLLLSQAGQLMEPEGPGNQLLLRLNGPPKTRVRFVFTPVDDYGVACVRYHDLNDLNSNHVDTAPVPANFELLLDASSYHFEKTACSHVGAAGRVFKVDKVEHAIKVIRLEC